MLELLLEFGVDLNQSSPNFGGALSIAASEGDLDMIRLLLSHGANPNYSMGNYYTALDQALHAGRMEILDCLLSNGADPRVNEPSTSSKSIRFHIA